MAPLLFLLTGPALAQAVPTHQIPPAVLAEMRQLENRFDLALAADCDSALCSSKGCTYVDHAVADRPRAGSLPGLGLDLGPGSVEAQDYLTQATCAFAYEEDIEVADVQALARRLQARLSRGWTVVSVSSQPLTPLPAYLREPPAAEEPAPEEPPVVSPEAVAREWTASVAGRELWQALLPHYYWMIGIGLATAAGASLIWSWRRVGRASPEEQALLAELAREEAAGPLPAEVVEAPDDAADYVAREEASWRARLAGARRGEPDPEIQALLRELLRAGELPLLAKAVLRFPRALPAAFPEGGELAAAKLELADFLKTVDVSTLPDDEAFFRALGRHALAASLANQADARVVRSLREDFGAAGLAALVSEVGPRAGALLFALAPAAEQRELTRLLPPDRVRAMSEQLLVSDRMGRAEADYLFEVLEAARADRPLPAPPQRAVADRGATFDAAAALSVLLPALPAAERARLFSDALARFNGALPAWYRGILVPDMLQALSDEARADLLLEVDAEELAAWLSLLDAGARERALSGAPDALRASLSAAASPSRARQLALAERGRRALARGLQRQLARAGVPFERAALHQPAGAA
jgi:hypothetical protein